MAAGIPKNFTERKNIRLPQDLYDNLDAEAARNGVGKVSTMARIAVLERLSSGCLKSLGTADQILEFSADSSAPRITMHLTPQNLQTIEAAASAVASGNFSRIIQLVLWERYQKKPRHHRRKA